MARELGLKLGESARALEVEDARAKLERLHGLPS